MSLSIRINRGGRTAVTFTATVLAALLCVGQALAADWTYHSDYVFKSTCIKVGDRGVQIKEWKAYQCVYATDMGHNWDLYISKK
ncbi:hypothetical protein J8N05_18665 [Streptomyces sp. BH-SS-21]|uniref:Uncharacterized protein n=1 Tax=Streptomyces liliiviolaceus TaxID=2823109 RepID=A0A940XZU5_9ACTN|nr:hypothetical protein [Streptomyces liliiviolaceus]MBQ0850221.1 hypothetical protein [Streptomyces liliiviolaceus]